ncbi:hypothetical protein [Polyangium mundeleinium]|uniref:Uncharacterized protein n=1 Tax=Polyangium mundeleinium TaxID=2995306 RepID=A0ABT5EVC5_9BACT|nr:hypothetical protein [Polyangium mundeleinium]MDC0745319.1 hypothetical protein [Polyangium mundeleinium]
MESLFLAMFVVALFSARRALAITAALLLALSYAAPDGLYVNVARALNSVLPLVLAAGLVRSPPALPRPALVVMLPPLIVLGAYPMEWLHQDLHGGDIRSSALLILLGLGTSLVAAALLRVLDARWLIVPAVYLGEVCLYGIIRTLAHERLTPWWLVRLIVSWSRWPSSSGARGRIGGFDNVLPPLHRQRTRSGPATCRPEPMT